MKWPHLLLLAALSACHTASYPLSDHCDGAEFFNPDGAGRGEHGLLHTLTWKLHATPAPWPEETLHDNAVSTASQPLRDEGLRLTFINHASVLIQWQGLNILTDPVFSPRLGPLALLNLKRYRDPGIAFADLPKIDYVFISHNHFDHLDLPSLEALEERDHPEYLLPLGIKAYLPSSYEPRIHELDWWQSYRSPNGAVEVTAIPAEHWSRRQAFDIDASLWAGAVFKARGKTVLFAGDTAYSPHFKAVRARLGPVDAALLPIGAYEPRWFMQSSHMNPAEAAAAHQDLGAHVSMAIHFGTFRLTDEAIEQPVIDLAAALKARHLSPQSFIAPKNGQSIVIEP